MDVDFPAKRVFTLGLILCTTVSLAMSLAADADGLLRLEPWPTDAHAISAEPTPFEGAARTATGPSLEVAEPPAAPLTSEPVDNPPSNRDHNISPSSAVIRDIPHTAALEDTARQADQHTRHAYELAGRGAFFAARSEFLAALRLVAEGLDAECKDNSHSHALTTALAAVKEAEDFQPRGAAMQADLDLPRIVGGHSTPILKDRTGGLTPLVATKCYLTFAQEQFAAASCHEVAAAMALHGLGKLHANGSKNVRLAAAEPKAIVYYQASLLVYPNNFMAANDLGVLLARCGNYVQAKAMLEYSLSLRAASVGWQNLSVVYRQLGQPNLAVHAAQQAAIARDAEIARRRNMQMPVQEQVRWIEPAAFAQTSTNTPNSPDAVRPANPAAASPASPTPVGQTPGAQPAASSQTTMGWFPWGSQNTRR
jgi:tetratricopeptide (TPR) repeat protein